MAYINIEVRVTLLTGYTVFNTYRGRGVFEQVVLLTLVLLNPDIPCLCEQCRSRSVGF